MAMWDWTREGPRWAFVIDTDSYAGNFEREMAGYIVGRCDEHGEHRAGPYIEMYRRDFPGGDPFEDLVEERVDDHGDDAIGRAPMALAPTPGYGNNGKGKHSRLRAGQTAKHPAYQSVAIFLSRRPTPKELKVLAGRAARFPSLPKEREWDERPAVIGCRLVEETVTVVSHDV